MINDCLDNISITLERGRIETTLRELTYSLLYRQASTDEKLCRIPNDREQKREGIC